MYVVRRYQLVPIYLFQWLIKLAKLLSILVLFELFLYPSMFRLVSPSICFMGSDLDHNTSLELASKHIIYEATTGTTQLVLSCF